PSPRFPSGLARRASVGGAVSQRLADARHHLARHQLHRALPEPRIDPVMPGIEQSAELADLFAEGEELVDDAVDAAADYQGIDHVIEGDGGVGHGTVALEELRPAVADELLHEIAVVEAVGAAFLLGVAPGERVVLADEDALGDAPVGAPRHPPGVLAALLIHRPVRGDPGRLKEV